MTFLCVTIVNSEYWNERGRKPIGSVEKLKAFLKDVTDGGNTAGYENIEQFLIEEKEHRLKDQHVVPIGVKPHDKTIP